MEYKNERDTGLAFCLLALLIGIFFKLSLALYFALILLILVMTVPKVFKFFAPFWFGFSHILGKIVSKIIMSIIFCIFVIPLAYIRRAMGKDSLQLRQWKKNNKSVLVVRDYQFSSEDMKHPF